MASTNLLYLARGCVDLSPGFMLCRAAAGAQQPSGGNKASGIEEAEGERALYVGNVAPNITGALGAGGKCLHVALSYLCIVELLLRCPSLPAGLAVLPACHGMLKLVPPVIPPNAAALQVTAASCSFCIPAPALLRRHTHLRSHASLPPAVRRGGPERALQVCGGAIAGGVHAGS